MSYLDVFLGINLTLSWEVQKRYWATLESDKL